MLGIATNLREVTYIECVVDLGGGGPHGPAHAVVDVDAGRHQLEQALLDVRCEVAFVEVSAQLDLVNVLQRARGRLW